jgi:hypothetical protein
MDSREPLSHGNEESNPHSFMAWSAGCVGFLGFLLVYGSGMLPRLGAIAVPAINKFVFGGYSTWPVMTFAIGLTLYVLGLVIRGIAESGRKAEPRRGRVLLNRSGNEARDGQRGRGTIQRRYS